MVVDSICSSKLVKFLKYLNIEKIANIINKTSNKLINFPKY